MLRWIGGAWAVFGVFDFVSGLQPNKYTSPMSPTQQAGFFLVCAVLFWFPGLVLFGLGSIAKRRKIESAPASKTCPFCAETVLAAAKICKHCGRDISQGSAVATA